MHKVFIRHTYIYKCGRCGEGWKINEAQNIDRCPCPHCGHYDAIEYIIEDQRKNDILKYT